MSGVYYTDAADWLRAVGLVVVEVDGWQTRARSSGGFPKPGALGVQWHHTASSADPADDAGYMFDGADDAPIGNMLLARDGTVWIGAAGAANTAGRGGPLTLSRGTIPVDGANSRTWAIEAANNGVGETWPAVQIDAYYTASNELNRRFGNQPGDVFNHQTWAPDRKIDPATAAAVAGPWRPGSSTSAGTWKQGDVTGEATRRASIPEVPDMPLTDQEIERIATAVWKRHVALKTGEPGDTREAGDLLGWAHANAEQAKDQIVAHRHTVEPDGT